MYGTTHGFSDFLCSGDQADAGLRIWPRVGPAPGGRFSAKGVTLKELISIAYGVRSFQVSGGPGWIGSERWSVDAKAEDFPGRLTRQELQKL